MRASKIGPRDLHVARVPIIAKASVKAAPDSSNRMSGAPAPGGAADPDGAPPTAALAVWWVRAGDMRLADNEALSAAAADPAVRYLLPVLPLDPSDLKPGRGGGGAGAGVPLLGPHKLRCGQPAGRDARHRESVVAARAHQAGLRGARRAPAPGVGWQRDEGTRTGADPHFRHTHTSTNTKTRAQTRRAGSSSRRRTRCAPTCAPSAAA
jgi:hypothetical protein